MRIGFRDSPTLRTILILIAIACTWIGMLSASDMGFKFVPNVAAGQFLNLSLPWDNQYQRASELLHDLRTAVRVAKFTPDAKLLSWTHSTSPASNFPIQPGEAYIVEADSRGVSTAVIVGSHDPERLLSFTASDWFNLSAPYHGVLERASDLFNDLESQLGVGSIERIAKFTVGAKLISWGPGSSQNFAIEPGEGVLILPNVDSSGYDYPHY